MSRKVAQILQYLQKLDKSEDTDSIFKYRNGLYYAVEKFLLKTDEVADSLRASSDISSDCELCMKITCYYVGDKADIYLYHGHATGETTDEEKQCQAFSLWFFSRMFNLLSNQGCERLHKSCLSVLTNMLQTLKWKSLRFYRHIMSELIHSLAELVQISEMLYASPPGMVKPLNWFSFSLDLAQQSMTSKNKDEPDIAVPISDTGILLTDPESCELLQVHLTQLLSPIVMDIYQLNGHLVQVMFETISCQLEIGDSALKVSTLEVLFKLLEIQGLPNLGLIDYFLECVLAMVDLLCSGCSDVANSDVIKLEEHTAQVTAKMCWCDQQQRFHHHFTSRNFESILRTMSTTLGRHGFQKLITADIKASLSTLLCHVIGKIAPPVFCSSVFSNFKKSLTDAMLVEIGHSQDGQFLVGPLTKILLCELHVISSLQSAQNIQGKTPEEPMDVDEPNVNRKQLPRSKKMKYTSVSYCLNCLTKRMEDLFAQQVDQAGSSHVRHVLEGIRVVFEVLLSASVSKQDAINSSVMPLLMHEHFHQVCTMWKVFLLFCAEKSSAGDENQDVVWINQGTLTILKHMGSILATLDVHDVSGDLLQEMAWMASLHWLANDLNWLDLKPANPKEAAKLSNRLADKYDSAVQCECLHILSLLPKDVAAKWRIHIFKQAMSDTDAAVRVAAVKSFPSVLQKLGPNANHLVHDLLHPLIKSSETNEVLESIATIAGQLACIVSRKAFIERQCPSNSKLVLYRAVRILCYSCDDVCEAASSSKNRPKVVDPNMFQPFLQLLQSSSKVIKLNLMKSMKQMFGHIGVRSNNPTTVAMLSSCLALIEDPDYSLRTAFSNNIQFLVGDMRSHGNSETDQHIVNTLKDAYRKAKAARNIKTQETVLMAIGNLGKVAEGDLLLVVVLTLLQSMLCDRPATVSSLAYLQLKEVACQKKTKQANHLFTKYKQEICKFLVDELHSAQVTDTGKANEAAKHILREVAHVLDFADVRSFLQRAEQHLLPHLVIKASPAASNLTKMIATYLEYPSRKKILINNVKYIFSHLVRCCDSAEYDRAASYMQKETDCPWESLLRLDFQRVHNELMLHLSTSYNKVFKGLRSLASADNQAEITTPEQMADYLNSRLLGFLAFFDSQLLNSNVPIEEKKLTMDSVTAIIRLMGPKYITTVRFKVMSTLRIGLGFKEQGFPDLSCMAWNSFVRSVELNALGPNMSQIIATLLPLLKQLPKQVAEIFNYMIIENRKSLHDHFHEVYFFPDIPELADANAILKQYAEGKASQSDLKNRIAASMQGATHESLDVRLHALSKLKYLLHENQAALHDFVIGNETADPIVSQLVTVLLTGCREPDPRAQLLYGDCLGELGAIDPGRLDLISNNPKEDLAKFQASVEDDNFTVDLINEIVRAYLAAMETRIQDCHALAIQKLLTIYDMSDPVGGKPLQSKLWARFPEHIKEVLLPFITSRYKLTTTQNWSKLQKPIYGSKKGSDMLGWVSTWANYLYSKVKPDSKPFEVFSACSALIKHDLRIALYLLPHVVLQVLLVNNDQDVAEICGEVMEVLTQLCKQGTRSGSTSDYRHMSAQTIFSILGYLTKWNYHLIQLKTAAAPLTRGPNYITDPGYVAVNSFLEKIPQNDLAVASFNCKAYTRALMYFESFITNKKKNIQDHLDFIQRIYVAMDEPDGVSGIAAIRQAQPTLHEAIRAHESIGQQDDAQACYDQAILLEPEEISHHQGLLRSLLELGQESKALCYANGILNEKPQWTSQLNAYRVEAAHKLGSWDNLETYVKKEKESRNWPVGLGHVLLAGRARNEAEFMKQLQLVREHQMGPLSAASMEIGSYQSGYEYIKRLHMMSEVEQGFKTLMDFPAKTTDSSEPSASLSPVDLFTCWEARLKMSQFSFKTQEPLLSLRRTMLSLALEQKGSSTDKQIGEWWLHSVKVARKAGHLQTAYRALLQASVYHLPQFFLEKAKMHWEKGETVESLACLEKGIAEHFEDASQLKLDASEAARKRKFIYAQALLLYGRYNEETSNTESNAIVKQYKDVIDIYPEWEDGHFYLAKYYDKMMTTLIDEKDRPTKQGEFIIHVVKFFGQSLQYGNQYIYQSMPRLLSLWLDYGTTVVDCEKRDKGKLTQKVQAQRTILARLNKVVSGLSQQLAPYQLLTAFAQLISRICHTQPEVFQQLQEIIATLLVVFPQQAMWMLMAVSKSSYPMRVKRCQDIFARAKSMKPELHKFIQDATKLTERLLELCERDFPGSTTVSVSTHFKPLRRLLEDSAFSPIIVPLQSVMTVTLPSSSGSHSSHNAFPGTDVFISGFEDTIEIIPSLQRPKKITMRGSDGRLYVMMCKPKDDLRKDCRLMEFNGIVNKFLRKDPESRRRQLHIRTYTVIPLNEECGLLEWVNNTSGLRHILMKLYKEKGLYTTGKELKTLMPELRSSLETKMQIYKQKLLPRHPPVFREWYLRTFPDPTAWYNARLAYGRTAAVMSMVGYILGLGDRHGENILFDSMNGDCLHVDFNCLFNKGETFEWPERVPFRLTHNMIDVLGPMGVEGIFRRACEVTLRVMRNQTDPLMSVLRPFIYDPLVEWSKPSRGQRTHMAETGEITNEQAMTHVQNIEDRLKGILKVKSKMRGLPLSIQGHVHLLIQDATDDRNLCAMYIGWSAYL